MARTLFYISSLRLFHESVPRSVETPTMNHGNGERLLRNTVAMMIVLYSRSLIMIAIRDARNNRTYGESLNDKQRNILFLS